jgi:predicted metal-binding protein
LTAVNFKDLTGQKFGRLTILEKTNIRIDNRIKWKCLYDCGNITYVIGRDLKNGQY